MRVLLILMSFMASASALVDVERLVRENEGAALVLTGVRASNGATVQSSGCFVSPAGHVLTTAHQVVGVEDTSGRDLGGTVYPLTLLEVDATGEMALLKTDLPIQHWARIGQADTLRNGAFLLSIAAPRGLELSTFTGIVSNTNRLYQGYPMLQADLPASPGSSGGPVFNRDGLLVGLIVLGLEDKYTFVNPVNNVFPILRAHGIPVPRPVETQGNAQILRAVEGVSDKELFAIEAYNRGVGTPTPAEKAQAYGLAVQLLPGFFEAWFNLAISMADAGDPATSEHAYRKAEALRPKSVSVQRNLGRLFLGMQRKEDALACFERAVDLAPDAAQSYNDFCEVLRQLERFSDAVHAFDGALQRDPKYAQAHYNAGLAYGGLKNYTEAARHFEAYVVLRPEAGDAAQVRAWIENMKQQ